MVRILFLELILIVVAPVAAHGDPAAAFAAQTQKGMYRGQVMY